MQYFNLEKSKVFFRIAQLQASALFEFATIWMVGPSPKSSYLSPFLAYTRQYQKFRNTIVGPFLAALSSKMLGRVFLNSGQISEDISKNLLSNSSRSDH